MPWGHREVPANVVLGPESGQDRKSRGVNRFLKTWDEAGRRVKVQGLVNLLPLSPLQRGLDMKVPRTAGSVQRGLEMKAYRPPSTGIRVDALQDRARKEASREGSNGSVQKGLEIKVQRTTHRTRSPGGRRFTPPNTLGA